MKERPKKGIIQRTKSFLISVLLLAVIAESILLYRLYQVNIAKTRVEIDDTGEAYAADSNLKEKVKNLRILFRDSSANAWATAQKSDNPEDAWFNIGYRPRADFRETADSYTVSIDVPGVKPAELSASLNGLSLTVNGVRSQSKKTGNLRLRERFRGEFSRTFDIPGKVSEKGISGHLNEGMLQIIIPKGDSDDLDIPIEIGTAKLM